jgi:catechol 2,3-dioxygenase-like lactoylglutathione lyase family enzyme
MLFDHVDLRVTSLPKVRALYDALLPAMGFGRIVEDAESICYYEPTGDRTAPFFCLDCDPGHQPNLTRLALAAPSRSEVDRLAAIARDAQAIAFEPPQLCEEYTPLYYAAFFEDRDGNKLEICFREAPPFE